MDQRLSEIIEIHNIVRISRPRYYLKRSNELIHAIYTNGIIRSSVCLGNYNELEPYIRGIQLKKGYWRPISKDFIFHNLFKLEKEMSSHVHILVKECDGESFGLEIGFQQNVSSFEDFFARNERLLYIRLEPSPKENHGMGYHFHLINKKGRTNVIVMFNKQDAWNKLLGEYHAEGHNKGNEINVDDLGDKCKQDIYDTCYEKGKKIPLENYKKLGENGFTFFHKQQ